MCILHCQLYAFLMRIINYIETKLKAIICIYRKNFHGKAVKAIICCSIFIFYLVFTL